MAYIKKHLNSGETIVFEARVTKAVMVPCVVAVVGGLSCFVFGILFGQKWDGEALGMLVMGGFFAAICGVGYLISTYIQIISTEYAITTQRIIVKTGLISRLTSEVSLLKVEGISLEQGILGRLLGFGTLTVSGTGTQKAKVANVDDPMKFRQQLQSVVVHK